MNYLHKSFSVSLGQSDAFRDNYDRIFGEKKNEPPQEKREFQVVVPHTLLRRFIEESEKGCGHCFGMKQEELTLAKNLLQAAEEALK